jgi:hypothetical protein
MAEFGVVASVVGIASFGIQITQSLLKYYGSWKDYDSDVSSLNASLDILERNLNLLSETIQTHDAKALKVKGDAKENISRVDEAIKKLAVELRALQGTEPPNLGVRAAMRRHVRRALYPLKEETLVKIQRAVSEALTNLSLILHALQMSVYLRCVRIHSTLSN